VKITKRQLRRIIKESMPGVDHQVRELWDSDEEESTDQKREELMTAVKSKFGLRHVRTTEEFDGTPGGVWLSGEEGATLATDSDLPLFDYYLDVDPYTFGIHPDFEAFVIDKFGFAPEWNDPGTLMLWPLD
jgi:hypothetical protein|tara:strand:- start:101 stop:493 length:393 start_codon:yes stop_codon:yes gene_type:complete